MKRRVSIVRNPGKGDKLANKSLTVKLDGTHINTLETGSRLSFDADGKKHTLSVLYKTLWTNLELNFPIPAGREDVVLQLDCENDYYEISECQLRRLTVRRDDANPNLKLSLMIDGKAHPAAARLKAGEAISIGVDTGDHYIALNEVSQEPHTIKVQAGAKDVEFIATVNNNKTVTVKKKKQTVSNKEQQSAHKPAEKESQKSAASQAAKSMQTPPAPKKPADVHGSSTTYHLKMEIKALLRPDGGELYHWLTSGVENVFMQAMDDAVMFIGTSFANPSSPEAKGKNIFYKETNQATDELRQMAKMTGCTFPAAVNPYDLLESDEEQETLQQILEEFIKSDQCPGITMINDEICLEPGCGIDIENSATTSFLKGDYLTPLFSDQGILCDALMSPTEAAEYLAVEVGSHGISFNGHFPGMKKNEVKTLYTILLENINTEQVRLMGEQMKGLRGMGPVYTSLETQKQRDELLRIIRERINTDAVYARMEGKRITVNPEANRRPLHPNMYQSLTAIILWGIMLTRFGENSDFAKRTEKTPAACFVTAEPDRLRVNTMFEDEDGTAEVFEMPYIDCTSNELPSSYGQLNLSNWQNRFERLDDPADQKKLIDYLMTMMDSYRHIIIEGNSFRSRRPEEPLIQVRETLTGQMMARKVTKLFDLDGEFIDIMRHSNIDFCHIAGYKDYLAFIFNDRDGNDVETIYRDFSELVDEEFLSGEDCFDHLTCGYEKDELSYFLGESVAQLPYMQSRSEEHWEANIVCINRDMVPMLSESYLAASAKTADPRVSGIPEVPELAEVPEVPAEPAWTVEKSPTTQAVIADLTRQFGAGGGMGQFMKDMGLDKAELMTGSSEIVIGFWRGDACTSRISMQYAQYASGEDGAYQVLCEEDQKVLQECILAAVPYFNV